MANEMDSVNVAVDVPQQLTNERWMISAGKTGYPTSFIVDRNHKIAWIGHPIDISDALVDKVLKGEFDPLAEKLSYKNESDSFNTFINQIEQSCSEQNVDTVLLKIDKLLSCFPNRSTSLCFLKYRVLDKADRKRAQSFVNTLLAGDVKEFDWFHFSFTVLYEQKDYALAIKVADRAFEDAELPYIAALALSAKSEAYFRSGMKTRAIDVLKKAIWLVEPLGNQEKEVTNLLKTYLHNYQKQ
jgi:tetratricopeptide (TPR) repeat protein